MNEIDEKIVYRQLFGDFLSKADRRKLQIIEAAIGSFASKGIEGTSFLSIGKLLGIPASHIAYYFLDKNELLENVMKYVTSKIQHTVAKRIYETEDPKRILTHFMEDFFDYYRRHPEEVQATQIFITACAHNKRFRKQYTEMRKGGHARIEAIISPSLIKKGQSKAVIRSKARSIYHLHSGALRELLVTDAHSGPREQVKHMLKAMFDILDA